MCQREWKVSKRPGEWVCRHSGFNVSMYQCQSFLHINALSFLLFDTNETYNVFRTQYWAPNGFEEHHSEFTREVPLIRSHISHLHRNCVYVGYTDRIMETIILRFMLLVNSNKANLCMVTTFNKTAAIYETFIWWHNVPRMHDHIKTLNSPIS